VYLVKVCFSVFEWLLSNFILSGEKNMSRRIGSFRKIKSKHRDSILKAASRLNGSASTKQGLAELRSFAEEEHGIRLDDLTLRRMLKGTIYKGVSQGGRKPLGIRPSISIGVVT
jgi:hypothetical protein